MSSIYVIESPTKGKVVVQTTMGPLDIELWPKEAPKATRNFVQLCLEGYYDRTIFHRVVKSFLVQGGDPTASGTGLPFEDLRTSEPHSSAMTQVRVLTSREGDGQRSPGRGGRGKGQ